MIVGTVMFHILFVYLAALTPLARLRHAQNTRDGDLADKWASFLLCVVTVVVPLLYIPATVPFRNDLLIGLLWTLSLFDASVSHTLVRRHVHPVHAQLQMATTMVRMGLECAQRPATSTAVGDADSDDGHSTSTDDAGS